MPEKDQPDDEPSPPPPPGGGNNPNRRPTVITVVDAPMEIVLMMLFTRQLALLASILESLGAALQMATLETLALMHLQSIPGAEEQSGAVAKHVFKGILELLDLFRVELVQTAMLISGQTDISYETLKEIGAGIDRQQQQNSPPPSFQLIRDSLRTADALSDSFSEATIDVVRNSDAFLQSLEQQQMREDVPEGEQHLTNQQMAQLTLNILQLDQFIRSQLNPRLIRPPQNQQATGEFGPSGPSSDPSSSGD